MWTVLLVMPPWCDRRDLYRALQSPSYCPLLENGFENGMEVAQQLWDHIRDWELENLDEPTIDSLLDACGRIDHFEEDNPSFMKDHPALQWLLLFKFIEAEAKRRGMELSEYEQAMPNCYEPNHPTDLLDYIKVFPYMMDGRAVASFWLSLPFLSQRVDLYHHLCHWLFDWGVDKGLFLFVQRQGDYKTFIRNNAGEDIVTYKQLLTLKCNPV